jgi:hypothetical protein
MITHNRFAILLLGSSVLISLGLLPWFAWESMTDNGTLPLALGLWLTTLTLSGLVAPRIAQKGRYAAWLLGLFAFLVLLQVGKTLERHTALPHAGEWLGLIAYLVAVYWIVIARHPISSEHLPLPNQLLSPTTLTSIVILCLVGVSVFSSILQFHYIQPLGASWELPDAGGYFISSEGLLRGEVARLGIHNPGFPYVITLTRLIYDNIISQILWQHFFRLLTVLIAYLVIRRWDAGLALLIGLGLALSPTSANFAHMLLTENTYQSLLLVIFFLTLFVLYSAPARHWGWTVMIAIGCAFLGMIRFPGVLIIALVLFYNGILAFNPKRIALLLASFTLAYGTLVGLQNRLFEAAPDSDVYYLFPLLSHELYNAENGPIAAQYQIFVDNGCYGLPQTRLELAQKFPLAWHECAKKADPTLSGRALYFEALSAKPGQAIRSMAREMRRFVTHSDVPTIYRPSDDYPHTLIYTTGSYRTDTCQVGAVYNVLAFSDDPKGYHQAFADYACSYQPNPSQGYIDQMRVWSRWFWDGMVQPYRYVGPQTWARFWAALLLLTWAFLESAKATRVMLSFASLLILYHAFVTTFGQWNLPRYIYVIEAYFIIVTLTAYWVALQPALQWWQHYRLDKRP